MKIFIVKDIIGSYEEIRELVLRIPSQNLITTSINNHCEELIYFLTIDWHKLDGTLTYKAIDVSGEKVRLMTEKDTNGEHVVKAYGLMESVGDQKKSYEFNRNQLKLLLLDFLELLNRVGN